MNDSHAPLRVNRPDENPFSLITHAQNIAVIGASKAELHELKLTGRPIKFLQKHGYRGRIIAVNPKYAELDGVPCYPGIEDVPGVVDVAAIFLPKDRIFAALDACGRKGVKAALVFSSGYGELGAEGQKAQQELVALARRHGMRLVGPNASAVVSVENRMVLSFLTAFGQQEMHQGNIAFASNSGALLSTGVRLADDKGTGFSLLASNGNEADLTLSDFVACAVEDERTQVVAAFVEGVKDAPGLFAAATRAAELKKPIVIVKVGSSERGGKVAASHTGAITGDDRAYTAAFRQHGITRARDLTELIDVSTLFARFPPPGEAAVAIVSVGSGGAAELMADLAEMHGVRLADFSTEVQERVAQLLTPFSILVNPIDIAGMTSDLNEEPRLFRQCMEYLLQQSTIGIFGVVIPVLPYMVQLAHHIVELVDLSSKPIIPMLMGGGEYPACAEIFRKHRIPSFATADQGARGMKAFQQYAEFLNRRGNAAVAKHMPTMNCERKASTRAMLEELHSAGRSTVTLLKGDPILAPYGLHSPRQRLARSALEARAVAGELGFPLALKIESSKILHKTELNGVRLGVDTADAAAAAFYELMAGAEAVVPAEDIDGVLMQTMVPYHTEVILGSTRDPRLGHVIVAGLGGIWVELLNDVALRVPRVAPDEARSMIAETRLAKVLAGFRGKPPADVGALVDAIVGFSQLIEDAGDLIDEIEVNPLFVMEKGKGARVGDVLISLNHQAREEQ